jgi:tungstate transport system permease protein
MHFVWNVLRAAVPLITHGNPYLLSVIGFTLEVAAVATVLATVIGLPVGLVIGLGRFRGRRALQILANAGLALPPALVGAFLFLIFAVDAPLGSLHLILTRRAVFIAQTILALPYVVALSAAAFQGLPPGLLSQARLLGAGRLQLSVLALREARIGVVAAIIAALGTSLSEVAAIAIVGGNIYGYDQTLASATLFEVNRGNYPGAVAIAIVLVAMILVLVCGLSLLQQRTSGIRLRFRPTT